MVVVPAPGKGTTKPRVQSVYGKTNLYGLHAELHPFNFRVTAVIAGGMRTPFLLNRFADLGPAQLQDPAHAAAVLRGVPLTPGESAVLELTILPMQERSSP